MASRDRAVAPATYRRRKCFPSGLVASALLRARPLRLIFFVRGPSQSFSGSQIQADENVVDIGKGAYHGSHRSREPTYHGRGSKDLIAPGQLRVLEQIDHLDSIPALEVGFAQLLEVVERGHRLARLVHDVKPQLPQFGCPQPGF